MVDIWVGDVIDERDVVTLYFDVDINRFIDCMGNVIHDIFRIITPGQLRIFKEYKDMYLIRDVSNTFYVELVYPEKEEDLYEIIEEEIKNGI